MPSFDRAVTRTALAMMLLLPLAFLAACGEDPVAPREAKRAFSFDHIAGVPKDSGYVCPPPAEGAVARLFVAGDGLELFPDGRVWLNVSVAYWERWPSSAQYASTDVFNRVGRWTQRGDTLAVSQLDPSPVQQLGRLAGDSVMLHLAVTCQSDESSANLTIVYKEIQP